jgi:hypothetical protein
MLGLLLGLGKPAKKSGLYSKVLGFYLCFFIFPSAQSLAAECQEGQNNRILRTYFILSEAAGKPLNTDQFSNLMGMVSDIGLNGLAPNQSEEKRTNLFIQPIAMIDRNANGGGEFSELKLGEHSFILNPEDRRKSDLAIGPRLIFNSSMRTSEAAFAELTVSGESLHTTKDKIGIKRLNSLLCWTQHFGGWAFVTYGANWSLEEKKLSKSQEDAAHIAFRKVGRWAKKTPSEMRLSFSSHRADNNQQTRATASYSSMFSYTSGFSVSYTKGLNNQSGFAFSSEKRLSLNFEIFKRIIDLNVSNKISSGGTFLGVPLKERQFVVNIGIPINQNMNLILSDYKIKNSFDQFNLSYSDINLVWTPIKF